MPANLFIILAVRGVRSTWRSARLGLMVATLGTILLCLVWTPAVADDLLWSVEALAPALPSASADMSRGHHRPLGRLPPGEDTRIPIPPGG
jgi:hypothetical protein